MKETKRAMIALVSVILIVLFISGLEVLTGKVVLVTNKGNLVQEHRMTEIDVFPDVVRFEKIGDFVIKDKIWVEVIPGSGGAYKEIQFFKKGSSRGFEEFNLKCEGYKCKTKTIGFQTVDIKWKTGDYIARVKDVETQEYVYANFSVENDL